jgi:hypothetical protein
MNIEIKNNNGNLCFNIRAMDEQEREILTCIIRDAEKKNKEISFMSSTYSNSQVHSFMFGFKDKNIE